MGRGGFSLPILERLLKKNKIFLEHPEKGVVIPP
jgi:hypothetical protein